MFAPHRFLSKGARYDKMIEAFGGIGYHATTPRRTLEIPDRSDRGEENRLSSMP